MTAVDDALARDVRIHIFRTAADTARVPQAPDIAAALGCPLPDVENAVRRLGREKALILAPNGNTIWAANPFCAVPSAFRVAARGRDYAAICIWDALGIAAALGSDADISTVCGDCGDPLRLHVAGGGLTRSEGIIHFAVRALHWWDNIGFT